MTTSFAKTLTKYLPTPQSRKKHKRQCLKTKNILEQNQSIQIGCKIQKLYDFYTSKNFVQVNIFIGNKMSKPIQRYGIEFRGTSNLQVFIEEKEEKSIRQNTQGKQRVVVEWVPGAQSNGEMLLTMSFTSTLLTLKDTVIPLSLWSFYNFPQKLQQIISPRITHQSLTQTFKQKYQLIEQHEIQLFSGLFRKGFNMKDMQKFFQKMIKLSGKSAGMTEGAEQERAWFAGVFTVKTLVEEVGMLVEVDARDGQQVIKVMLAGNQYAYFQAIFQNIKFLFGK